MATLRQFQHARALVVPQGAPIPDPETWSATRARLLAAIDAAIASVVHPEGN